MEMKYSCRKSEPEKIYPQQICTTRNAKGRKKGRKKTPRDGSLSCWKRDLKRTREGKYVYKYEMAFNSHIVHVNSICIYLKLYIKRYMCLKDQ